jgi:hypothetical protein
MLKREEKCQPGYQIHKTVLQKLKEKSWVWSFMPVISTLGKQEDHKIKASLGYVLSQKKKKGRKETKEEIRTFLEKQRLREFIITRPSLQKLLQEFLQAKMKVL